MQSLESVWSNSQNWSWKSSHCECCDANFSL